MEMEAWVNESVNGWMDGCVWVCLVVRLLLLMLLPLSRVYKKCWNKTILMFILNLKLCPSGINEHSNNRECLWIQVMSEQLNEREIKSRRAMRGLKSVLKYKTRENERWTKRKRESRRDRNREYVICEGVKKKLWT